MLKYLRSRRRPPYGPYLCVAISSLLLLLLSVSLLYTGLSRSLPHPHLLHTPFHEEEDVSGTGESVDKMDELDNIDEDQYQDQKGQVDLDEEYQIRDSGYFFDHVSGCIRRGFNKRSIEEWEDDRVGLLAGSGVEEDRSKAAFASDDTPVDEAVRRKATQVMGIEDALLLKMGRRESPLREGWGDWFDKKGEFLKKDMMLKSNWAVLDPMTNLLLQDPDGVGVSKLTEVDRELKRWWIKEFLRTPFLGKKTSGTRDSDLQENDNEAVNYNASACKCKSVGVSKLTKVERWWRNEFNRTPFLGEKTLDISRVTRDSDLQENDNEAVNCNANSCKCKSDRESRSETDGTERRTFNDNAINEADKVDAFKNDKVSRSENKGAEDRTLNENVVDNGYTDDVGITKLSDGVHKVSDESVNDESIEKDMNSDTQKYLDGDEHGSGTRQGNSVDQVGKLDRSSDSKDVVSEIQRRPEFLNHIYADGQRWGYYPGLPPHLAFTEFMDAFFRMGKCHMRVFMVWNSPPWMYGVRHQRGLESLLYHHRDACVVVFSETIELDFFKDSFVNDGYKVAVTMPNLDELLKDTPTHIFASLWFEWRKIKFYSTHYSDLIRLAALYKYGGIYLDSDIIVLKPISSLNNSVGMEDHIAGSSLNGAVMAFRRHSLFIKECLKEFYSTYDDTSLRWNGADLLTRVATNILKDKDKYDKQWELKVEPTYIFFPVSSLNITRYFMAPTTETEKALQDGLFEKILHKSLTFHFWNSLTSSLIPEPESLVARLINYPCIRCSELL